MDIFIIGMVVFVVGIPLGIVLLIRLINRAERNAVERVRRTGTPCLAYVKGFRRVSMTQHKVLFEIRLPTGAVGREYMLSGLNEAWLADAAALGRPVQVVADLNASTIAIATA